MSADTDVRPVGPGRWMQMPYWFRDHVAAVRGEYASAHQETRQGPLRDPVMPGPSRHPGGHAYTRRNAHSASCGHNQRARCLRNAQEGTR